MVRNIEGKGENAGLLGLLKVRTVWKRVNHSFTIPGFLVPHQFLKLFTKRQNITPVQIESICR